MTFNDIATQFYNAGAHYSAAVQPYAIKLFFALLLLDILVTWISSRLKVNSTLRTSWVGLSSTSSVAGSST